MLQFLRRPLGVVRYCDKAKPGHTIIPEKKDDNNKNDIMIIKVIIIKQK